MDLELKNLKLGIEKGIAKLTLNRPKHLNVLNMETLNELDTVLTSIAENESVKVVIFNSASDKVFTAGADIKHMSVQDSEGAKKFAELGHRIARKLETMPQPVIMMINGFAMGGGTEFACACDIRIASEKAVLAQPEIDIGVIPGWGGTQRLARIVGPAKAKELIYTGKRVDAYEALEIGLVNQVVPVDRIDKATEAMAEMLASKSRIALTAAKRAINKTYEVPIEPGLEYEIDEWAKLFDTHDQKEGMKAFLEGRKPEFKDE
jgi:enoyl-CoA hydratase